MKITDVELGVISVPGYHRTTSAARVEELADSILELGLLQPIGLTRDHALIYGRHRLEACRLLGRSKVHAIILDLDEMKSEMATIDENLRRVELSAAQYAKQLKRRKELYEAMHPETKAHKAGGHAKHNSASDKMSFAEDAATKTGKSRRTVERDIALADKLDDHAVETLGDHPVADNKTELKKLAELPAAQQQEVADKLASGKAETVNQAVTGKKPRQQQVKQWKIEKETPQSDDYETLQSIEDLIRDVFSGRLAIAADRLESLAKRLRKEA